MPDYPIVLAHGIARFDAFAISLKETSKKLFGNNIFLRPILAAMEASVFLRQLAILKISSDSLKGMALMLMQRMRALPIM